MRRYRGQTDMAIECFFFGHPYRDVEWMVRRTSAGYRGGACDLSMNRGRDCQRCGHTEGWFLANGFWPWWGHLVLGILIMVILYGLPAGLGVGLYFLLR